MMVNAATSVVRNNNRIEVALVLDNTGSMSADNKLQDLVTSADDLIDTLAAAQARSVDPTAVKMSLVPFAQTVRVGSTYQTATWMDQTGQAPINNQIFATTTGGVQNANRFTLFSQMHQTWAGCVETRQMPYDVQDTAPSVSTPATLFTPYFAPDEPDPQASGKNGNFGTFYNNYLTDGTYSSSNWKIPQGVIAKYNNGTVKSGSNASTGYVYGPNAGCQMQPLVRLSSNLTGLKTTIAAMTAVGDTNIPLGLMWGWNTLSANGAKPRRRGRLWHRQDHQDRHPDDRRPEREHLQHQLERVLLLRARLHLAEPHRHLERHHRPAPGRHGRARNPGVQQHEGPGHRDLYGADRRHHRTEPGVAGLCVRSADYYFDVPDPSDLDAVFPDHRGPDRQPSPLEVIRPGTIDLRGSASQPRRRWRFRAANMLDLGRPRPRHFGRARGP